MSNYPGIGNALQRMQHPALGAEDFGAMFKPQDAFFPPAVLMRQMAQRRRQKRQQEEEEAAGDDMRADELGRDDDVANDEATGAHGQHTSGRIEDIQREISETKRKLITARSERKRRRLNQHLSKLNSTLARKRAQLAAQLSKGVQRGRLSPAAAAAIAASAGIAGAGAIAAAGAGVGNPASAGMQPGTGGYPSTWGAVQPFNGQALPESLQSRVERSNSAGQEIRIPMLIAGAAIALITVAAGAGLRSTAIAASTTSIPFAGFQVTSLDVILNVATGQNAAGFANQDILINVLVSDYQVFGEKNLLYGAQSASYAGQEVGMGGGGRRTLAGLRENQVIQPTNTITLDAVFRQEITTAIAYNATIQFAAVVRTLWDPAAGIGPWQARA